MDFNSITYEESAVRRRKRSFILRKSFELFSIQGIAKTSLNDIIKKVGMTARNIYYYYPNKEAVATDVYCNVIMDIGNLSYVKLDPNATAFENLRSAIIQYYDNIFQWIPNLRFLSEYESNHVSKETAKIARDSYANLVKKVLDTVMEYAGSTNDHSIRLPSEHAEDIWLTLFYSMYALTQRYIKHELDNPHPFGLTRAHIYLQVDLLLQSIKGN